MSPRVRLALGLASLVLAGCASRQRIRVVATAPDAEMRYVTTGVDGLERLSAPHRLPHDITVVTEPPAQNGLIAFGAGALAVGGGMGLIAIGIPEALGRNETGALLGGTVLGSVGVVVAITGLAFAIGESVSVDEVDALDVYVRTRGGARWSAQLDLPIEGCRPGQPYCATLDFSASGRGASLLMQPAPDLPALERPVVETSSATRRRPFDPASAGTPTQTSTRGASEAPDS